MNKRGHPRFYELMAELQPRFEEIVLELMELHDTKNADYSEDGDPLSNFKLSDMLGVPPWKGSLVRLSDKFSRITQLAKGKKPKVHSESIIDTLRDLAVYALLTIILWEEELGE